MLLYLPNQLQQHFTCKKMQQVVFACVGKPSAGKSTFLNSVSDANAKVGSYPFTTIEPNHGVAWYRTECICSQYDLRAKCMMVNPTSITSPGNPRYGKCIKGIRHVWICHVAGLIPGAHAGLGLGNKFLDDLRHADVFLHVIDASGTTNEKGENTTGYDPSRDVDWLVHEVEMWIFGNLWNRWPSISRKMNTTGIPIDECLQAQVSGYSCKIDTVQRVLDQMDLQEPYDKLSSWDESKVREFVKLFVSERFPTVLGLNKIDQKDSAKNIDKICARYGEDNIVLISALSECFLQKMAQARHIYYNTGDEDFKMFGEELSTDERHKYSIGAGDEAELIPASAKMTERLTKLRDLVMFRYGGTGCNDAIAKVIQAKKCFPVYVVDSVSKFDAIDDQKKEAGVFRDVVLVPPNTTVKQVAKMVYLLGPENKILNALDKNNVQLSSSHILTPDCNIIKITLKNKVDVR